MKKLLLISLILLYLTGCDLFTSNNDSNNSEITITLPNSRALIDVASISLTISGTGMSNLEQTVNGTSSISVNVPVGSDRTFDIVVTLENGNTLVGSSTQDISSDTSAVVIILDIAESTYSSYTHIEFVVDAETGGGPGVGSNMQLTVIDDTISWLYKTSGVDQFEDIYRGTEYTKSVTTSSAIFDFTSDNGLEHFEFDFNTENSGTFLSTVSTGEYTYSGTFTAYTTSRSAEILEFDIEGDSGIFNGTDIAVTYNGGDVSALTPTISLSIGAFVSPASGSVQNFTSPVNYIVTAADGTIKVYTVTVTIAPS
ncbi:MAG: DUF5018 domain-containing protein [Spirochaetaceae bacterium]